MGRISRFSSEDAGLQHSSRYFENFRLLRRRLEITNSLASMFRSVEMGQIPRAELDSMGRAAVHVARHPVVAVGDDRPSAVRHDPFGVLQEGAIRPQRHVLDPS